MAGLAVVIVLIILIAGHAQPPTTPSTAGRTPAALLPDADRIRAYQQQLADDETRLKQMQTEAARITARPASGASPETGTRSVSTSDTRRREEQSLLADNVAFTRRPSGQSVAPAGGGVSASASLSPDAQALVQALTAFMPRASAPPTTEAATVPVSSAHAATPAENPAPGQRQRLLEGTVIETVLINRLDSTFAGPVDCLVTTPVYAFDRQAVLIPAGARVLGTAAPVQAWGESFRECQRAIGVSQATLVDS
jgi:type IV secretory pathway VirB10-like protein